MRDMSVTPYDSAWIDQFQREAVYLKNIMGDNFIAVHHVGSTSIPGIVAKPVIDMLGVVKDITQLNRKAFEDIGYTWRGERGIPFRRFLHKGDVKRTHHLHIYEKNDPQIERHLLFREYVINHPEDFSAYESLKKELSEKYRFEQYNYTAGKDSLIGSIVDKAGFTGLTLFEALLDAEWEGYHKLRHEHDGGYDHAHLAKGDKIKHFVFKQGGSKVVAAAQANLGENHTFEIVFIKIAETSNLDPEHLKNILTRWGNQYRYDQG